MRDVFPWWQPSDWFLVLFETALVLCILGKVHAIYKHVCQGNLHKMSLGKMAHDPAWAHVYLQYMVIAACVWLFLNIWRVMTDLAIIDTSRLWLQIGPVFLLVVVLTVYGWAE